MSVVSPFFLPLSAFALLISAQLIFNSTASRYFTRVELQLLITYLIVIHLMNQVFQRSSQLRKFVWFLMSLGFFVSIFGILQHLTFNGKLYWLREMRFGGIPFGPYVNRNHFAGFAELLIPLALVPLVLGKVRRQNFSLWSYCHCADNGTPAVCLARGYSQLCGRIRPPSRSCWWSTAFAPGTCRGQGRGRSCGLAFRGLGAQVLDSFSTSNHLMSLWVKDRP